MRARPLLLCVAVLAVSSCAAPGRSEEGDAEMRAALVEDGREIVEAQCAGCHAVGVDDSSPRDDAPPLRAVLAKYDPDALAEDFREGVHVGHPDMPDFSFGTRGVDAVLAYLVSIQLDDPEPRPIPGGLAPLSEGDALSADAEAFALAALREEIQRDAAFAVETREVQVVAGLNFFFRIAVDPPAAARAYDIVVYQDLDGALSITRLAPAS